jgi:hypothetical protein
MIPLVFLGELLVEVVLWAAVGVLVSAAFGTIGELIVADRLEEAEAEIAALDAGRRAELLATYRKEKKRMSKTQRARWKKVLRSQGLLD